jgi:hypothetical protein
MQQICILQRAMVTARYGSHRHKGGSCADRAPAPAVARQHDDDENFFGYVPEIASRPATAAQGQLVSLSRPGAMMAALRLRCLPLVPFAWRFPPPRNATTETTIDAIGSVEIHRMQAGCFVGTCVNGEPVQALETGLKRLLRYLNGDNGDGVVLQAERPLIRQQLGPRRWRISVRLPAVPDALMAPAPHAPKVKLWTVQPEWLAVVRMTGRPTYDAVAGGDARLLDAITRSEWVATGAPMLRLHGSGPLQWLTGGFEVALPVLPRCQNDAPRTRLADSVERLPDSQVVAGWT